MAQAWGHPHTTFRHDSVVAVVGAGSIGLVAAKEILSFFTAAASAADRESSSLPSLSSVGPRLHALQKQLVVFERGRNVGGVWRSSRTPYGNAYDSLCTNSSRRMMELSDFPWSKVPSFKRSGGSIDLDTFPTHDEVCEYFQSYCIAHNLQRFISFGTEVMKVERQQANHCAADEASGSPKSDRADSYRRWKVTYRTHHPSGGSSLHQQYFDFVFCCTGQYHRPKIPPVRGFAHFQGTVLHSHDYHSPHHIMVQAAKAQPHHSAADNGGRPRVVVVGIGNSALDIALELCEAGAEVILAYRSSSLIIPVSDDRRRPIDCKLLSRFYQNTLPSSLRGAHFFWMLRAINASFHEAGLPSVAKATPGHQVKFSNLKEHQRWHKLLATRRVSFRPQLCSMHAPRSVSFDDGSTLDGVNAIVFCTGYRLEFPYLDAGLPDFEGSVLRSYTVGHTTVRYLNLYKSVLAPSLPGLVFLGMVTSLGNETCVGEMQARWAVACLSGKAAVPLPSSEAMSTTCQQRVQKRESLGFAFPMFVSYVRYMDELAREIGCLPKAAWWRDPALWWRLWVGPVVAAQYRLDDDEMARNRVVSKL